MATRLVRRSKLLTIEAFYNYLEDFALYRAGSGVKPRFAIYSGRNIRTRKIRRLLLNVLANRSKI